MNRNFTKLSILLLSVSFMGFCGKEPVEVVSSKIGKAKEDNGWMYINNKTKRGMYMEIDENLDAKPDSWIWVDIDPDNQKDNQLLFEKRSIQQNGQIDTKIWYGPGNLKLVGVNDFDKNGSFESFTYYNNRALPKVLKGIVARIETDSDGDGQVDVWIYPGQRAEWDSNGDGLADKVNSDPVKFTKDFQILLSDMDTQKWQGSPLSTSDSWVEHPEKVASPLNQAVIPRSISKEFFDSLPDEKPSDTQSEEK